MGAPRLAPQADLDVARKIEIFRKCPLLQDADQSAFDFLAAHSLAVTAPKGEPIILENEANDHVYFIAKGSIEIVTYVSDEKRIQRIALLKEGANFAELSVLSHGSKSGSAYAYEASQLLRLPGAKFIELLNRYPGIAAKLALNVATINDIVESTHEFVPFYQAPQLMIQSGLTEKMPAQMWPRFGAIPFSYRAGVLSVGLLNPNNVELFQFLDTAFRHPSINAFLMNPEEFEEGLQIAKAHSLAPVRTRKLEILRQPLPDEPLAFLKTFPLTKGFAEASLAQMGPHIEVRDVKEGEVVAEPGQHDAIQVILSGKVEVSRAIPQSKANALVMTHDVGDMIGAASLLTGKPTHHTYRALENGKIATITGALIKHLMASPVFTIPLTVALAARLSKLNSQAGIKYVKTLDGFDAKSTASLLPISFVMEHQVVPLKAENGEVWLGLVNSNTKQVIPTLSRYVPDYRLRFFGLSQAQFDTFSRQLKAAADEIASQRAPAAAQAAPTNTTAKADPVGLLNEILSYAVKNRASDIHFEPSEEFMTVRFRIDGVLQERQEKIAVTVGKEMVSRIKVISSMDVSNSKATQDGQLKTTINDHQVMARASVLPLKHGEKVVLRMLKAHGSVVPLSMLVPDKRAIKILQEVSRCRQGLFLVTGPTGSGKTTTLYSLLSEINRVGVNIVTLEEPVELEIPGCNQAEVDRKRGIDFAAVLRSVLRQDPDVIMVGEIRDEESARIVFEAAITGHMVLSTLHTTRSTDVGPRLMELGVPGTTIAAGLVGVLTQRLVRAICKKCVSNRPITMEESEFALRILGDRELPQEVRFGQGCPACSNSGYHDRVVVLEVWRNTPNMRKALSTDTGPEELMKIAREDGFETILEVGLKLALAGLTTIEEVRRTLGAG